MGFIFKSPEEKVDKLVAKRDVNGLVKLLDREDTRFPAFKAIETMGGVAIKAVKPYLKTDSLLTNWSAAELLKSLGWEPTNPEEHIDYLLALQQWEQVVAMGEKGAIALLEHILSPLMGIDAKSLMRETAFCRLLNADWLSTGNVPEECSSPTHRNVAFQFLRMQGGYGSEERFRKLQAQYQDLESVFLFLHFRPALALLDMGWGFVDNIIRRLESYKLQNPGYDITTLGPLIFVLEEIRKKSKKKQSFMLELVDKLTLKAKADSDWMEFSSFLERAGFLYHKQIRSQFRLHEPCYGKWTDHQTPTSSSTDSRVTNERLKSALNNYVSGDPSNIFYMLHQATAGNEQGIICLGLVGDLRTLPSLINIRDGKSWDCVIASAEAIRKIFLLSIETER